MHESAQAGELSRVPHLPLEADAQVMHRQRDDRSNRGPPEEATDVRRRAALHGHADHRQAHHGRAEDDRRVGDGVVERHGEDGKEDQGREPPGRALQARIRAARDQEQCDRGEVADGRNENGPTRKALPRQKDRQGARHEDRQTGPVQRQIVRSRREGGTGLGHRSERDENERPREELASASASPRLTVVLFHGISRWRSIPLPRLRTSVGHQVPSYRAKVLILVITAPIPIGDPPATVKRRHDVRSVRSRRGGSPVVPARREGNATQQRIEKRRLPLHELAPGLIDGDPLDPVDLRKLPDRP